ncbi:hypothetical protein GCM10010361_62970 [Streptomyces olivaceiscleroticus]|uniref:ATP-binding protein n=1 Tax=Streptomyces olivaceiscleroticus TaxID=68245 RepID=A0ABN1B365_9ACTN
MRGPGAILVCPVPSFVERLAGAVVVLSGAMVCLDPEADGSTAPPGVSTDAGPAGPAGLGERGRGLALVHALSRHRGWTPLPGGKTVWAELAVRRAELAAQG